jgi:uncharacterized protein YpiB (UPF0302 family)
MDTYAFDLLIDNKTKELMAIYEDKVSNASNASSKKNKKMTTDPSVLDFNSKKLLHQINAAFDKKLKSSNAYKKKCEKELSNIAPH